MQFYFFLPAKECIFHADSGISLGRGKMEMFKQIRSLMSDGDMQLEGPTVEMDETYYGGRVRGQGSGIQKRNKVRVAGIVERKGKVIEMKAGDVFYIAPGHDSWVVGNEPYVSLHLMGANRYAVHE